ncbi:MAG: phosphodiester glycosidase family protein [Solobacterium sp.]|nr:phosphodiester glycosidase family protein [Solobacterium sp.]
MAKRKSRKKIKGISPLWLVLCLLLITAGTIGITTYRYYKVKYTGSHPYYSRSQFASLNEDSLEYKIASRFYSDEEIRQMRSTPNVTADIASVSLAQKEAEEEPDKNGDGIWIEHIYADTYEGYMMVVKDPMDVNIEINPGMNSGAPGPELDYYVDYFKAAGAINGGGFEDVGGRGDGSIPQGLVIKNGNIVRGTGATRSAVVAFDKDHNLITTTATGSALLNMGVVDAITFGPTFITNGRVVYTSADAGTLNIMNPRTAVGQQEDGTMLLLVIDGRGPSSWGAKYEDVIEVFKKYGAVNAGNLDGGNSSVMIYNGGYVHYPVSMYNSRNLPSVITVGEEK